ncbi:MAG: hypothetical protein A3H98_01585 [Bacteroidetes bacterium RIFCSPLOWO2_02_FULL_36_8]|nr:MAG: hypothetical protein A3H98_01585 [Bacteroidetes bacterium RIFCSPLOWO2_02_FULL_36_8]OFY69351.1 MAG: hypothetical protein A3G23_00930 [Bacteroidetes bacterium RIFCSPLOWO2_12_FULL_37_12]
MKKYVLDANVLMSALISGKQIYLSIFERIQFFVPDFIITEIEKYKFLILEKTKLKTSEFNEFANKLFQNLSIIPSSYISEENINYAMNLCMDIDEKDTMYVALSLQMSITLVTRDIPLFKGLKKKGFKNVILFDTLFNEME